MVDGKWSALELGRVAVVLVRARNPNNIGAVARAMHDFGFADLRVVNEYPVPFESARSAVDASSVLAAAQVFATVAEAIADCALVVGTTAVGERVLQHRLLELRAAAEEMRGELVREGGGKIALLFGSEKTGLSNDELSHCHWLTTIPMQARESERHLSMNLGQAAAVCLYEMVAAKGVAKIESPGAGVDETERLTTLLLQVLEMSEYGRHHPANSDAAQMRRTVMRMKLGSEDVAVWMGMLRQILWKMRAGAAE